MLTRRLFCTLRWLLASDATVLLAVSMIAAGTWGFVALADSVADGRWQTFDEWGMRSLRQQGDASVLIGPEWMTDAANFVTALGGVPVLAGVSLTATGVIMVRRNFQTLAFAMAAIVGGLLLMLLLKEYYARPRPQIVPYLCAADGSSFPSGHSMMSAVVYLTVGALWASTAARRRSRLLMLAMAFLLAGLIGASRVCLGVHYPSDVLAGWTAGLAWASFCWLAAQKLNHRSGRPLLSSNDES
jgi:undecaprenyl-diphosphatase